MKVVGGYRDWLALELDARDLDDVLLWLQGESEAARIRKLEERRGAKR